MQAHSDGMDEELHKAMQSALLIAGQFGERLARARANQHRQAEAAAAQHNHELMNRFAAERAAMTATVGQVWQAQWWQGANEHALVNMANLTASWSGMDHKAAVAYGQFALEMSQRYGVDLATSDPETLLEVLQGNEKLREQKRRHEAQVLAALDAKAKAQEGEFAAAKKSLEPKPMTENQRGVLEGKFKLDLTGTQLTSAQASQIMAAFNEGKQEEVQKLLVAAGQDPAKSAEISLSKTPTSDPMSAAQAKYLEQLKVDHDGVALSRIQASKIIDAAKAKDQEQVTKLLAAAGKNFDNQAGTSSRPQDAQAGPVAAAEREPMTPNQRGKLQKGYGADLTDTDLSKAQASKLIGAFEKGNSSEVERLLTLARQDRSAAVAEEGVGDIAHASARQEEAAAHSLEEQRATVVDLSVGFNDPGYLAALEQESVDHHVEAHHHHSQVERHHDNAKTHWDSKERREALAQQLQASLPDDPLARRARIKSDLSDGVPANKIPYPHKNVPTPKPRGRKLMQRGTEIERGR